MKIIQYCKCIYLLLLLSILFTGCFRYYYRTNSQKTITIEELQQLQMADKYFIIHFTDSVKAIHSLKAVDEKIEGVLTEITPEHTKYLRPDKLEHPLRDRYTGPNRNYRVKAADRKDALREVHLYADMPMQTGQPHASIPLSAFKRIDIYALNKDATTANHVLSIIGVGAIAAALILEISFLIACNCPQVYVKNDADYQFVSGVYSGAIYSSLERTDYLPLGQPPMKDNIFNIKIKNVEHEQQFINRMQLMQVQHPEDVRVLLDRHGKPLSYKQPQLPRSVFVNGQTGIDALIAATDSNTYQFDGPAGNDGFSSMEMTFAKPADAKKAKLVLHARNSSWSGYLYHSFAQLFGSGYEKWRNEKDKSSPKEMEEWQKNQSLPLTVYIERNGKWQAVDYFPHTGNTASRDLIMELDLAGVEGSDVKLKLATAYRFWDIDYAGIDYSPNAAVTTKYISPAMAGGPGEESYEALIESVDDRYALLEPKQELNIGYKDLPAAGATASYFFVATGYYHNTRKYEGKPQLSALLKFRNKGEFDRYSRHKYEELEIRLAKLSPGR